MRIRVIDLETTGFDRPLHAPIEVAFTDLFSRQTDLVGIPETFEPGISWSSLCRPGRSIPPESSAIHHIVDDDVKGRASWMEVIANVVEGALEDGVDIWAAHNAKFERQWFFDDLVGRKPWICTYKCALRLWPEAPGHSNMTLRYWRKPPGLQRARAEPAHRAGPDAYVTAFLLRDMLEETPVEKLIQWTEEPAILARIPFGQSRGQPWSEASESFLHWVLARDFDEDVMFTARHWLDKMGDCQEEGDAA